MPVNIHGNQYVTVAERIQALHADKSIQGKDTFVITMFLPSEKMVICKATLKIGDNTFTGTSAANPAKAIEKQSPYEVAETSAIGRAAGFAGYGLVDGIATADEIVKATQDNDPIMKATTDLKVNYSLEMCRECHAPSGKYHTRSCPNAN